MKRILQVLSGNQTFSGVSSYLYQQYLHIDRTRVRYDFLFCKANSMKLVMSDPIFADSRFYVLDARTKRTGSTDYVRVVRELDRILRETRYDAVVANTSIMMTLYACLRVARRHKGVRFIAHAHNISVVLGENSLRRKLLPLMNAADSLLRRRVVEGAFALFACSEEAGKATFGAKAVQMDKFRVVRNAIDLEVFRFRPDEAERIRRECGASGGTLVIGNVGRLDSGKNQAFLLRIFALIHNRIPDSQLWLIGDGRDRQMLAELARKLGLEEQVVFLGERTDVCRCLQGMDAFVFTSLSEGLGIVAVEAQAAGLPTLVSDGVPDDVLLTPLAVKCRLSDGAELWADTCLSLCERFPGHPDHSGLLREKGYHLAAEAEKMTRFYLSLS